MVELKNIPEDDQIKIFLGDMVVETYDIKRFGPEERMKMYHTAYRLMLNREYDKRIGWAMAIFAFGMLVMNIIDTLISRI